MGTVTEFPVKRVESFGLWEQERRRARIEQGFPLPADAVEAEIDAPSIAARRFRRSLIGDDVA